MIRSVVVCLLVFLTIATFADAAAWHTPGKHSGCYDGFCWTTCAFGWCYTTPESSYSQSGVYIKCSNDVPCDSTLKCAGSCTVWEQFFFIYLNWFNFVKNDRIHIPIKGNSEKKNLLMQRLISLMLQSNNTHFINSRVNTSSLFLNFVEFGNIRLEILAPSELWHWPMIVDFLF